MMSGHGTNPIFFNKKIKIGRPKHSLSPHLLRLLKSHFYLPRPTPDHPNQSGVDVICVSPLQVFFKVQKQSFADVLQNRYS